MIKLLFIDDDKDLCALIKRVMGKSGEYEIECAFNGAEGINALRNYRPDIVVTDVEMEKMDGISMVRKIRENGSTIPIIVLTGRMDETELCGADVYLEKPFTREKLDINIKNLLQSKGFGVAEHIYKLGKYTFNSGKYLISSTDGDIDLQQMESRLLEMLCKEAGNYVLKNEILGTLWPCCEKENAAHNLDVQMGKIKELFSKEDRIQFITKKGVGIMLKIK
ncbi:MAG: response regulator transcription factor [Bacteroidales bacterium]|jgi:DNA-binding response OmpR family regulator|nr:response regulator transcription factor [Bacteroidales bacterium]MCI1733574.1 response regulator transcription factor [Bacteroidales bacterium]